MPTVHHQSTFDPWPLPDRCAQAVITSPPYWQKRRFDIPDITIPASGRDGESWTGQYGQEEDFRDFVAHTLLWVHEAGRVLRDDGLFFLNLADSYLRGTLLDIPERISVAMIDSGWYKRNDIVWLKANGIPGSMKSRFLTRHENIFVFAKIARPFFNLDAVRVPYQPDSLRRFRYAWNKSGIPGHALPDGRDVAFRSYFVHPGGAAPGDVWYFSAGKYIGIEHYAMWPGDVVRRMVLASTREGDLVVDPFCRTGVTLKVAEDLGREAVGIDMGYEDEQVRMLMDDGPLYMSDVMEPHVVQEKLFTGEESHAEKE